MSVICNDSGYRLSYKPGALFRSATQIKEKANVKIYTTDEQTEQISFY